MVQAVCRVRSAGGSATATCIHPAGWFLTCAHSVVDAPRVAVIREAPFFEFLDAALVDVAEDDDLALLKVDSPHPFPSLKLAQSEAVVGERVWISGCVPWGTAADYRISFRDGSANLELEHPVQVPGTIAALFEATDTSPRMLAYIAADPINTGWSGGAVVSASRMEVVGIHSGNLHAGIMRGSPLIALWELVWRNKIRPRAARGAEHPRRDPVLDRKSWRAAAEWRGEGFLNSNSPGDFEDPEHAQRSESWLAEYREHVHDAPLLDLCEALLRRGQGRHEEARSLALKALEAGEVDRAATLLVDLADEATGQHILSTLFKAREPFIGKTTFLAQAQKDDLDWAILRLLWSRRDLPALALHLEEVAQQLPERFNTSYRKIWLAKALSLADRHEDAVKRFDECWESDRDSFFGFDIALFIRSLKHSSDPENLRRACVLGSLLFARPDARKQGLIDAAECAEKLGLNRLAEVLRERGEVTLDLDVDSGIWPSGRM